MTPEQIYALPSRNTEAWFKCFDGVVERSLQLDGWNYGDPAIAENDTGRLDVQRKLDRIDDSGRPVSLHAYYFDGRPFALSFTSGKGGRNHKTHVTDPGLWSTARGYALSVIGMSTNPVAWTVELDADIGNSFAGTAIASFGGDVRMVDSRYVSPLSGSAVFDTVKLEAVVEKTIRKLAVECGDKGLADPRMLSAAIEAVRAGVPQGYVPLDIDISDDSKIVAASVVDGQTFVYVMDTAARYSSWRESVNPRMLGPASLLEAYRDFSEGRLPSPDAPIVREVSDAFGVAAEIVHREIVDLVTTGGKGIAERMIGIMPRDERVPENLTVGYASYAAAHMVLDDPDIRRFSTGGKPDLDSARDLVEQAEGFSAKIASGEMKAPAANGR